MRALVSARQRAVDLGIFQIFSVTFFPGSADSIAKPLALLHIGPYSASMRREDEDVFFPTASIRSEEQGSSQLTLPPAGPHPKWTAEGVIATLLPLVSEERRHRLEEGLSHRIASVTVVLDNPHDPHNGSAVLRSCDAFGVQRVHVVRHQEVFAASRMVAKGSQRWVDIIEHPNTERAVGCLRASNHRILVTHPRGRLSTSDLAGLDKVAFVLGNERDGVSQEFVDAAHDTVRIDMCGFVESLNMSVSAAILVHEATRGRHGDLSPAERQNVMARWLRNSVPRADEVLDSFPPC